MLVSTTLQNPAFMTPSAPAGMAWSEPEPHLVLSGALEVTVFLKPEQRLCSCLVAMRPRAMLFSIGLYGGHQEEDHVVEVHEDMPLAPFQMVVVHGLNPNGVT